jgi:hypothetical protein
VAKLGARGRHEMIRAERGHELRSYLSDGNVLRRFRGGSPSDARWRTFGKTWDRVKPIAELRRQLRAEGFAIVRGGEVRPLDQLDIPGIAAAARKGGR